MRNMMKEVKHKKSRRQAVKPVRCAVTRQCVQNVKTCNGRARRARRHHRIRRSARSRRENQMRKQQCRIACGGGSAAWRTLVSGGWVTASETVGVASQ